jgi:3-phosphoinositide dependent protein kinase-1
MSFPQKPIAKQREDDFEIGEMLGRGTYCTVYEAVDRANSRRVALKVVDRYRCQRLHKAEDLYMEKHILRRTNHPNIIKMLGWFSDTAWVWVVMEHCGGGELWDAVKTVGAPDNVARFYFAQVVDGLEYLRQANIVHRDIKAENIMLTEDLVIKLIDFGTAKDLENPHIKGAGNKSRAKVFEDYVGTPQFMPQEVIKNERTDFRSDTWSTGCLFFQVLTGCPPFHAASEYLVMERVLAMDLQIPPGLNPQAVDLITTMVVTDADKRLGALSLEDLRRHPYFEGVSFGRSSQSSRPVLALADACLQKIGRQLQEYKGALASWDGLQRLDPKLKAVLERMQLSKKWQDDATPDID